MRSKVLRKSKLIFIITITALFLAFTPSKSSALEEVGADSRIRTFIYGKNDVYRIITSFGYQTTLELESDEKIKTLSLGNSGSFKVTPKKNRIFIRTLQGGQLTNMIVITDKRTYQIELSSILDTLDEMMYVVRFYYPDSFSENLPDLPSNLGSPFGAAKAPMAQQISIPEVNINNGGMMPPQQPFMMPSPTPHNIPAAPQFQMPMQQQPQHSPASMPLNMGAPNNSMQQSLSFSPKSSMVFNSPNAAGPLNYNYSLTGPEYISPTEVYDDGIRTYMKFLAQGSPIIKFSNSPAPVNFTKQGDYYVVDGVAPSLTVYFGNEHICIYNESINSISL